MAARTLLDELELPQAQCVDVEEEHALEPHAVPALEGDFVQRLQRRAARVSLTGVITGEEAREGLGRLREKFRLAAPVDFVADITTATRVGRVLIEHLEVRELAGRPERFEYAFALREFIAPPRPRTERPPRRPPPPPPPVDTGTLVVEVTVEGQPDFDMSRVTVSAELRDAAGGVTTRTLTDRTANVWTAAEVPPGDVLARAVAAADGLAGSAAGAVRAGQTTRLQIVLQPRRRTALAFVVHFRFDSAFVEPCMREVLARAVAFGNQPANAGDRLLVVGHTDKVGPDAYNQSLSERRARAVFAFLTFGRDPDGAVREWTALRQPRPPGTGSQPTLADRWGVREYQQMLQDLGWYPGTIDGIKGGANSLTNQAIRAFRCRKGLPAGIQDDDEFWDALIRDYLGQDGFAFPAGRLLPNCPDEPLQWLGCGEEDPVNSTTAAHRPNRRVELLFVPDPTLPPGCQVPEPDTFRLPPPDGAGTAWCLGGPPANSGHNCFLTRPQVPPPPTPPPPPPPGRWQFELAEPATFNVTGRISREVRQPDGSVRTPLEPEPARRFVAITPTGEFLAREEGDGEPRADLTQSPPRPAGTFDPSRYTGKPEGVWTVEVRPRSASQPVLVRLEEDEDGPVDGAVVCKRLHTGDTALNVVILAAPVVREIRLPAVAHVLTALNPSTAEREVRTCPTGPAGAPQPQQSSLSDDQVRAVFAGANRIWRQGRVRFDLVDIVREAYTHRTDCEVDHNEFVMLLQRCAYPGVVNVFLVGDLAGGGEAGFGLSFERAAAQGLPGIAGCALGDRFQLQGTITLELNDGQRVQVLAHEFGHYLDLRHVDDVPANGNRLMFPNTGLLGTNRRLEPDEVTHARGSQAAADDCTPLSLRVTGAARVGGTLSNRFIFVRDPASPATVTVDADIPARMLEPTRGALVMAGGTPGATPLQQIVPTGTPATVEVTATYTPVGGTPVVRRVFVHVVDFDLRVPGQTPETPGGNTFLIRRQAGGSVRVVAELSPAPFCVPSTLVTWDPDDPATRLDDPLQRRVSIADVREIRVRATVAGITREVRITVFDLAVTNNTPPFNTAVAQVQIEGILNADLTSFGVADLVGTQAGSLFRLRVDLPGVTGSTLTARLRSLGPDNALLEQPPFTLTRTAGDRFVSRPVLAIPSVIERNEITFSAPQDLEVIRCRAGGTLELRPTGRLAGQGRQVRVRGRVVNLNVQAFSTSGITAPVARRHLRRANRLWAQAGIEVRERAVVDNVVAPAGLDDLDANVPSNGVLTAEERRLLGLAPGGPSRSAVVNDLNVYYVRSIPALVGRTYSSESFPAAVADPASSGTALDGSQVGETTLAHEMGHHFLRGWPGGEHNDSTGAVWPDENIMRAPDPGNRRDVHRTQVQNILNGTAAGTHPCIVFEP